MRLFQRASILELWRNNGLVLDFTERLAVFILFVYFVSRMWPRLVVLAFMQMAHPELFFAAISLNVQMILIVLSEGLVVFLILLRRRFGQISSHPFDWGLSSACYGVATICRPCRPGRAVSGVCRDGFDDRRAARPDRRKASALAAFRHCAREPRHRYRWPLRYHPASHVFRIRPQPCGVPAWLSAAHQCSPLHCDLRASARPYFARGSNPQPGSDLSSVRTEGPVPPGAWPVLAGRYSDLRACQACHVLRRYRFLAQHPQAAYALTREITLDQNVGSM